jgi:hypothetical protein
VAEDPAVRSAPSDVARQGDGSGLSVGDGDGRPFGFRTDALDVEVLSERAPAARVHHARGGADVRVRKAFDVLREKIDEPSFSLEQRKDEERRVLVRARRFAHWASGARRLTRLG